MWDHRCSPWEKAARPETRAGWRPDMEGFHVRVRTYHGVDISFPIDPYSTVGDLKKQLEYYAGLWWTDMELHAVGALVGRGRRRQTPPQRRST